MSLKVRTHNTTVKQIVCVCVCVREREREREREIKMSVRVREYFFPSQLLKDILICSLKLSLKSEYT